MPLVSIPFIVLTATAIAGILMQRATGATLPLCSLCFAVAYSLAWFSKGTIRTVYVIAATALMFASLSASQTFRRELPHGERLEIAALITEQGATRGRWHNMTAHVSFYRPAKQDAAQPVGWLKTAEKIQLYADTSYQNIRAGDELIIRGWCNPVDTTASSYGPLMLNRGITSRIYLVEGNLITRHTSSRSSLRDLTNGLQQRAVAKISLLGLDNEKEAVVRAMAAGDRRSIERELRSEYNATGAAHLLAVSGLHVGIVFLLINVVLFLLPTVRSGHIIKNIAAIALIWLYTAMTGLAPSAVRAALMFSFAQIALASSSRRNAFNIMFASAFLMLAIKPSYIAEPGFLLSYSAVFSILAFFNPIYNLLRTPYKMLNLLISLLLIGLTASAGTMPLISHYFGNIPLASILLNPLLSLTAYVIVMCGVLWIVCPFTFMIPFFRFLLDVVVGTQNRLVEWASHIEWLNIRVCMPAFAVIAVYAGYVMLWLILEKRHAVALRKIV